MQVYTYSEARQRFAEVLERAEADGKVMIRRRDGRSFSLSPEKAPASPLDVPAVSSRLKKGELVSIIREGRERS
jgi:antitoxin (DNA-binding transcriptional repressor) of toxin-antitoxin stability system